MFASLPRVAGRVEGEPTSGSRGPASPRAAAVRAVQVELAEPRALLGTAVEDELAPLVSHCTHPVSSGGGGGGCFLPVPPVSRHHMVPVTADARRGAWQHRCPAAGQQCR